MYFLVHVNPFRSLETFQRGDRISEVSPLEKAREGRETSERKEGNERSVPPFGFAACRCASFDITKWKQHPRHFSFY